MMRVMPTKETIDMRLNAMAAREDRIIDIIAACEAAISGCFSFGKYHVAKTMERLLDQIRLERETILAGDPTDDDSDEQYEESISNESAWAVTNKQ